MARSTFVEVLRARASESPEARAYIFLDAAGAEAATLTFATLSLVATDVLDPAAADAWRPPAVTAEKSAPSRRAIGRCARAAAQRSPSTSTAPSGSSSCRRSTAR